MSEWVVASGKKSAKKSSQGFKVPVSAEAACCEDCSSHADDGVPHIIERLDGLKEDLRGSRLYKDLLEKLQDRRGSNQQLQGGSREAGERVVTVRVVAFGIGKFTSNEISLLQFALLLCLLDDEVHSELKAPSVIFDPLCGERERLVCSAFNIKTLEENIHGKFDAMKFGHSVDEDRDPCKKLSLFYMPHCSYSPYGNVLWCNWSCLSSISILGNSFDFYSLRREVGVKSDCDCMRVLLPHVTESEVWSASHGDGKKCKQATKLKFMEAAFNDMNLMFFGKGIEDQSLPIRPHEESLDEWNKANDPELH